MIKVLIADDHQMFMDGLKAMLKDEPDIEVVGEALSGLEVLEFLAESEVDLILLDVNMPDLDGIDTCRRIKKNYPLVNVLALTMFGEGSIISSMVKNGAKGYILKNTGQENLVNAIKAVHNGGTFFSEKVQAALVSSMMPGGKKESYTGMLPKLTRREQEILNLIVNESTTKEIADQLFISLNTVETHRKHLLSKLNVRNTAGLVRIALEKGLLDR